MFAGGKEMMESARVVQDGCSFDAFEDVAGEGVQDGHSLDAPELVIDG